MSPPDLDPLKSRYFIDVAGILRQWPSTSFSHGHLFHQWTNPPPHSVSGAVQRDQIMFQTPQHSFGSHKLDVVYQGNSQSTPLTLMVLIVQNGIFSASSLPCMTDSTGGVSAARIASTGSNSTHNSSNLGPIIGGVVGGLALLFLAIFGCLFLRRRRMKDTNEISKLLVVEPFNQPPTATLSSTGSGKSTGTSHVYVQH